MSTITQFPTTDLALRRMAQQEASRRLREWDGTISPEAARQGQADQDAEELANACSVLTVFPVHD